MGQLKPVHLFAFTNPFLAEHKGLRDAISAFLAEEGFCIPPTVYLITGDQRIHMGNLIYVSPSHAIAEMRQDAPGPTFILLNEARDADLLPLIAAVGTCPRTVRAVKVLGMQAMEYPLKLRRP